VELTKTTKVSFDHLDFNPEPPEYKDSPLDWPDTGIFTEFKFME
jgi:hypothetical protein